MKKLWIISLVVTLSYNLVAKEPHRYLEAQSECPAYNNMKHTNNSNDVKLKVGDSYRVLTERDGQRLILVEGERIAQRWVDASCFKENKGEGESKSGTLSSLISGIQKRLSIGREKGIKAQQNLLAISWQNAFCQTHQYKKECRGMDKDDFGASHFVLHGLWPQPRNNQYCNVSKKEVGMDKNKQWNRLADLDLNRTVRHELAKVMPGYASNLHKHEWIKHGTCYGTDANDYYADAIMLLEQINNSALQRFFEKNMGKKVTLKEIRKIVDQEFGHGTGEHVTMNCQKGLITELWFHIGGGSTNLKALLKKGETPKSRCFKGIIDRVGF